ncbi:SDR family oxidoreductase [Oceanobacillus sojae]|uniref:SDR family oxidoreductase n=1 Tax=Oceanobacillus sojae TaxID=582851 RepID=UPI0021A64BFC|nr:NmrA family NAD(P)-binding protein [Oceanobacillus sojae]MCT1901853.1 NmrA family NAD(P)-binding protein [Oceanobacillus sojae]
MLLVTGITGHTGKYFIQELINYQRYNKKIRCTVRESSDTSQIDNSGLNIEKVFGDLNDELFIKDTMVGIREVLHIYNIHHSPLIVKEAIEAKVERIILVHTTGIFSDFKEASQNYKNIEKEIFQLAEEQGYIDKITIIRPSMIYGDMNDSNMSKFIKMVDRLRLFPVIDNGKSLIQPVNARDLGKAYFDILLNPEETKGKQYNLTGKNPITLHEALKTISKELNKKTVFFSIPLSFGVLTAKIIRLLTVSKIDIVEKVQRMAENRSYSHEEASNDFNYAPIDFNQGIKKEIDEYLGGKNKK